MAALQSPPAFPPANTLEPVALTANQARLESDLPVVPVAGSHNLQTSLAQIASQLAEMRSEIADVLVEMRGDLADTKAEIRSELANVRAEMCSMFASLRGDIQELRSQSATVQWRLAAHETASINSSLYDGTMVPFHIISFPDGTIPEDAQPPLPRLLTATDVEALTETQLIRYLRAYFPNEVHQAITEVEARRRLSAFIGCTEVSWEADLE